MTAPTLDAGPATLPFATRARMLLRLLTVQASYNYESMIGNGIAFAIEPALRRLPGGRGGEAYRAALARQSRYFNAHPYLTSIAVGALARAEADGVPPEQIERFRTACCGPLGASGDRLVWVSWLPCCALVALAAFGLGASPAIAVLTFLGLYNAGHLALRFWGLIAGWRAGLGVAAVIGLPLFRTWPDRIALASVGVAGFALPLVMARATGAAPVGVAVIAALALAGGVALHELHGRLAGWRAAMWLLGAFMLAGVLLG
ncbi:MAG: PTS system mannose/fructose/sorbose family transporter subunit IID [Gemmatimonadetes bacterium]|nr:PTS system mannose/fructose/sorbose family transporter subunit IID [Gemmatimonadota bacterium]